MAPGHDQKEPYIWRWAEARPSDQRYEAPGDANHAEPCRCHTSTLATQGAVMTTCHCCKSEPEMSGPGSLGRNCFMLWYDAGISGTERLSAESLWRKERGYWPWGDAIPSVAELRENGFSV